MNWMLAAGVMAGTYGVTLVIVATLLLIRSPNAPVSRAFGLFTFAGFLTYGTYGMVMTPVDLGWLEFGDPYVRGMEAIFRVAVGISASAWILLALVITRPPARMLRAFGIAMLAGASLGLANYANINYGTYDHGLKLAVQSLFIVIAAFIILVGVLRARRHTQPGTIARRRADSYLVAFLIHDIVVLLIWGVLMVAFAFGGGWEFELPVVAIGSTILLLAFIPSVVYAILTGRVVDLDDKFRFGLSRTTIAGIFIAVFVGMQTLVSEFFTSTGGLLAGSAAAALLVFALNPLQSLAQRIADRALPHGARDIVSDAQRSAFYREQVEIAYSDGHIGTKERQALRSVRERLGLSAEAALGIEEAVAG